MSLSNISTGNLEQVVNEMYSLELDSDYGIDTAYGFEVVLSTDSMQKIIIPIMDVDIDYDFEVYFYDMNLATKEPTQLLGKLNGTALQANGPRQLVVIDWTLATPKQNRMWCFLRTSINTPVGGNLVFYRDFVTAGNHTGFNILNFGSMVTNPSVSAFNIIKLTNTDPNNDLPGDLSGATFTPIFADNDRMLLFFTTQP